ncbi:MAG: hypothetical protein KGH53_01320 [Candidatus Micrarchaeota archaeon]|nr:hypothetical protein [Candidatus Micrarchaeota archaeon]
MAASKRRRRAARPARRIKENGSQKLRKFALALLIVLLIYSVFITFTYLGLQKATLSPGIVAFPIKFYVNSTASIPSNLISVPLNQTFCPQNSTISAMASSATFSPYYTVASFGQNFTYTFFYNSTSKPTYGIGVTRPFKLNYFKAITVQTSQCKNYPYALNGLAVNMQAPNSTYVGNLYIVKYNKN